VDYLLRRLVRTSMRRGLAGEHWAWLLLGATAWVLRRALRPPGPVVLSTPIERGERLLITLRGDAAGGRDGAGEASEGSPVARPGE
jgi:hypothetical protein